MSKLKLFSYFRSSASYRVRLALAVKNIDYGYCAVHLVQGGGAQNKAEFRSINPMGHVPALVDGDLVIAESMAVLDYLDHKFAGPKLFPSGARERAKVIQICEVINSGIQPLQNLKVNKYLTSEFGFDKPVVDRWNQHWIKKGLSSLESILVQTAGSYSMGGEFTAADCFLLPQCFSSRRFGVNIEEFPTISRIEKFLNSQAILEKAHPKNQPDFEA